MTGWVPRGLETQVWRGGEALWAPLNALLPVWLPLGMGRGQTNTFSPAGGLCS